MTEPIAHCRELNEAEKRRGEFFIARADTAVAFDAAKEVFNPVATPVVTPVEGHGPAAVALGRDADAGALPTQPGAERIGIEALVGDRTVPTEAWETLVLYAVTIAEIPENPYGV
jgi:hypothetical protein